MTPKPRLLIVDDEANIRRILQVAFEKAGYAVSVADSAESALSLLQNQTWDVLLTDVTMPGMSGYELLQAAKRIAPQLPVVIMTAYGTIPQAIQAIRDGAHEFVTKPFDLDALKRVIEGATRGNTPKLAKTGRSTPASIIAASPAMQQVLELVDRVADSKATVMIGGESGVGKEVVAIALHERSSRRSSPFIAVSCAALPETLLEAELFGHEKGAFTGATGQKVGRFEAASQGTIFLDEIGEIPLSVQVKLLRTLQERTVERLGANKPTPVDVRVITATHRDLHAAVESGAFRLDLLYRLQVVEIVIPPLRERVDDIEPLASYFLAKFLAENHRSELSLSSRALTALQSYRWPGNVRELENVMERAVVLSRPTDKCLDETALPRSIAQAA